MIVRRREALLPSCDAKLSIKFDLGKDAAPFLHDMARYGGGMGGNSGPKVKI